MSIPRSTPLGVACLLFAALACADPVVPAAPAALRATLHSLWEASPEIAVARAQLAAARASARAAAQPVYNPELELAGENADVDRRTLGLGLALDLSGKRGARAAQGEAELAAAQAAFDLQRRDVAARWLKAWSAATFADRELTLGERRVALMRRFDELAAKRLAVGDISSPERDLAGLATAEAQAQQASLAGRLAASRAALAALGADVAHALPEAPAGLPPSADDIVARADDTLPEST
ncbi:MAG: TolC family protein, partial [Proteobacteria bacterium]|nr:TolC family protein [Pseudomonadota bacterium]